MTLACPNSISTSQSIFTLNELGNLRNASEHAPDIPGHWDTHTHLHTWHHSIGTSSHFFLKGTVPGDTSAQLTFTKLNLVGPDLNAYLNMDSNAKIFVFKVRKRFPCHCRAWLGGVINYGKLSMTPRSQKFRLSVLKNILEIGTSFEKTDAYISKNFHMSYIYEKKKKRVWWHCLFKCDITAHNWTPSNLPTSARQPNLHTMTLQYTPQPWTPTHSWTNRYTFWHFNRTLDTPAIPPLDSGHISTPTMHLYEIPQNPHLALNNYDYTQNTNHTSSSTASQHTTNTCRSDYIPTREMNSHKRTHTHMAPVVRS